MKEKFLDLVDRLKNYGTFMAVVGGVILVINQFHPLDLEWFNATLNLVGAVLVSLGVLNNPSGNVEGYLPLVSDPKEEK